MKRMITYAVAAAISCYAGLPSVAFAQDCSNGTEEEAQQFAYESCRDGRWQESGYSSFDQCYYHSGDIYYSSVNEPGCATGGGGGQHPWQIGTPGGGGGGGGGCTGTRLC